MKNSVLFVLLLSLKVAAQNPGLRAQPVGTLNKLNPGDSVIYYQCHVEQAIQQMATVSGQTITGKPQKYSITEKYVVYKTTEGYIANYYTSSLNVLPNRKFSGLKIRERPYWEFKREKTLPLTEQNLVVFAALENKGKEAIEYDYVIDKYNTNQLIIKQGKKFKQLVIEGDYLITKLLK